LSSGYEQGILEVVQLEIIHREEERDGRSSATCHEALVQIIAGLMAVAMRILVFCESIILRDNSLHCPHY
jgi:hypothetical protein